MRAAKSVSGSRIQKIQEDLIAAAKKETSAAVEPQAVARIGKEENLADNVVVASVGNDKILYGDVKKILRGLAPAGTPHGQPDLSRNPGMIGNILERELTIRALVAYAKKQGGGGSEGYKAVRQEMERFVLRNMVADNVAAKNVEVTDKEIEAAYAEHSATLAQNGQKIPVAMVAMLKERIRAALLNEKGQKVIDAYVAELKKKAKVTVNDAVLPKV
ncbi:MAG TPA: hypothetical protein VF325_05380, partial [Candidatus Deferrimicrobium sp.]